ncbi:MAG: GNAT family N-acetyltransferase [Lachnospiraceae bacterium]|nr:GNAT family N-acetyltransferase [Lachnospiraceae bacterium]
MDEEDLIYLNSQPDGKIVLTTPRLKIRELVRKNAASVLKILSECPEYSFLLPPYINDVMSLGALIAGDITDQYRFFGYGLWGVSYQNKIIGLAMLKNGSGSGIGEIGYAILKEYRNQGLMTETMLEVLEFAKEQGFSKIEIETDKQDQISHLFFTNLMNKYYSAHPTCQGAVVDSFSFTL